MLREYINYIKNEMFFLFNTLAIFALVFYLGNLDWEMYFLAAGIVVLFFTIYLVVRLIFFREQENLREKLRDLEEKVQLLMSEKIAQRNDLEEYFLLWVHQIKTPITAANLLIENYNPSNNKQLKLELDEIEKYTNMTMNYLKISNFDTDLNIGRVELDKIIQQVIKKYRLQFIYSKTKLHYEATKQVVITDPNWCSVILEQILSNALKYASGKDVWIYFEQENFTLNIDDNGVGISADNLPRLFSKGYSGFNGQLNEKSSGLGLYLVKRISERLEQKVEVKSTVGKGSSFRIKFHKLTKL